MTAMISIFYLAVLQLTINHVATGEQPDVIYEGKQYVEEGFGFTIRCFMSDFNSAKWTKNGKTITSNGYRTSYERNETRLRYPISLTLTVEAAMQKHSGIYKCNSFSQQSQTVTVVPKDISKPNETNYLILEINQPLTLECKTDSQSFIPLKWYKDERLLYNISRIKLLGNKLRIEKATENDAGSYTCAISVNGNFQGAQDIGNAINVYSKAKVDLLPETMSKVRGTTMTLECKTRGHPIPQLIWYIGEVPVDEIDDERMKMLPNSDGLPNALLRIKNLQNGDRGFYKCHAENFAGDVATTSLITVRQNMLKTNEDEDGGGIVMETSKPLVIQCTPKTNDGKTPETSDGMTAEMKWKKDGQEINSTDVHREIVSANNSLVIASPNDEDTGNYTCYLHNDPSKYRVISVRTSPQVEKFQKSMNVAEGDTLTLICKVIAGIPMPSVMWYKGADSINGSHGRIHLSTYTNAKIQVENSKLVIENVEFDDRAQYKCVATNAVSADFSTILVRVKDKYAALWPFLGICAEVAVLCTIIFVYEKRRTKPDFEESDTDNCPDGKNTTDHKNQELRQRK